MIADQKEIKKQLRAIAAVAYPAYKGRKIYSKIQDTPLDVRSFWDEGGRTHFTFVNLKTMQIMPIPAQSAYDRKIANADAVIIPQDCVCVTYSFFMGHDCGCTIIWSNEGLLPSAQDNLLTKGKGDSYASSNHNLGRWLPVRSSGSEMAEAE